MTGVFSFDIRKVCEVCGGKALPAPDKEKKKQG
jgi:hypothetical protein